MDDGVDAPEVAFKMGSSATLSSMVAALLFDKKDTVGMIRFNKKNILIAVEKAKAIQGRAYLQPETLIDYELASDSVELTVNLTVLYRCLTVFGDKSHFEFSYCGFGHPIVLVLEDQGIVTQCKINTLDEVLMANFGFRTYPVVNRVVMKSSFLRDALGEMDVPGSTSIDVTMSSSPTFIKFASHGTGAVCEMEFPDDPDIFSVLECKKSVTVRYNIQLIRLTMKALALAEQTHLRMNEQGMLLMQHSFRPDDTVNVKNWIDFILCPNVDDDDDDSVHRAAGI